MLEDLYRWTVNWAHTTHAEIALLLIAFAESSFFPIPPDILLIAMGVANPEQAFWYALLCSIGSVLGGSAGYGLGRWGGRPLVRRLFSEKTVSSVQRLYHRYDMWAIAIAGFTPLPYKVFTLSAGIFHIKFGKFVLASVLSRPARFFLVGGALYFWGEAVRSVLEKYLNLATILLIVALVGGFIAIRWMGKRKLPEAA